VLGLPIRNLIYFAWRLENKGFWLFGKSALRWMNQQFQKDSKSANGKIPSKFSSIFLH